MVASVRPVAPAGDLPAERRLRRRRASPTSPTFVPLLVALVLLARQTLSVAAADDERRTRRRPGPAVVDDEDDDLAAIYRASTSSSVVAAAADLYANSTSSHARNGRSDHNFFVNPKPADLKIECQPLKSKRYISDGFCTSVRPVVDFVCTGSCLPIRQLPWYAEFIKVWSHTKTLQYRCVDDVVRHRKVAFACDNGETRSYRIRVVRSCRCKRYVRSQNESPAGGGGAARNRNRRRKKMRNLSDDEDDADL